MAMSAVKLRVYDLSRGMARAMSMGLVGQQFDGIYHSGVEVYGREYFFGGGSTSPNQSGVSQMSPQAFAAMFGMQPVEVLSMGTTEITQPMFEEFIRSITPQWCVFTHPRTHAFAFTHPRIHAPHARPPTRPHPRVPPHAAPGRAGPTNCSRTTATTSRTRCCCSWWGSRFPTAS